MTEEIDEATCGNCGYFNNPEGECWRYPPQLVFLPQYGDEPVTRFPAMQATAHCGEHTDSSERTMQKIASSAAVFQLKEHETPHTDAFVKAMAEMEAYAATPWTTRVMRWIRPGRW